MKTIRNILYGTYLLDGEGGGGGTGSGSGEGGSGGSGGTGTETPPTWTPPTKEEWDASQAETNRAKQAAADADKRRRTVENEVAKGDAAKEAEQVKKHNEELEAENATLKSDKARADRDALLTSATKDKVEPILVRGLLAEDDYKDKSSLTKAVDGILKKHPNLKLNAAPTDRGSLPGGGAEGTPANKNAGMNAAIRTAAGRGTL